MDWVGSSLFEGIKYYNIIISSKSKKKKKKR